MADVISLTRRDLTLSSTAVPRGMCIYPPAKKPHQRIVMADLSGKCAVFGIGSRLDRTAVFDVAESDEEAKVPEAVRNAPISCITLYLDQLFLVRGTTLLAYSRKGKMFFTSDTHVTETVSAMFIDTPYIFLAGEYMATTLKEGKELGFYMSPDKINAMAVFVANKGLNKKERDLDDFICCLGCNDRVLRLVQDNKLLDEVYCEAPITALHIDYRRRLLFYGTQVGSMGVYALTDRVRRVLQRVPGQPIASEGQRTHKEASLPVSNGAAVTVQSPITCISTFDVNRDEASEILVGYDDGTVRVLSAVPALTSSGQMPPGETALDELWIARLGESIMSIGGGVITGAATQPDLLVHLFSGALVAFTLDRNDLRRASVAEGDQTRLAAEEAEAIRGKTEDTRRAIEALQAQIAQRTAELARRSATPKKLAEPAASLVAVASTFTANISLTPIPGTAMLSLVVQADVPVSHVVLRSLADVSFIGTESTQVCAQPLPVPSASERRASTALGAPGVGRTLSLAVARPLLESQDPTAGGRRLEVRLWADEGQAEKLSVTIYALPAPRTAQEKLVRLCALPLYSRVASIQSLMRASEAPYALSQIVLSGTFPVAEVESWLAQLLPGLADGLDTDKGVKTPPTTYFASEFLQSVLIIEKTFVDEDGAQLSQVSFTSDSLTALSTIRRVVAALASLAGYVVSWRENILFGSAARRLSQLEPVMRHCSDARRRARLLEGLRELQTDEGELSSFLPTHLLAVMNSPDEVMAEAARQGQEERYLKRAVVQLYASLVAFCFHAPSLSPSLKQNLESAACGVTYSHEDLIKLVFPKNEHLRERERLQAAILAAAASGQTEQAAGQRSELPSLNVSDSAAGVEVSSESDKD